MSICLDAFHTSIPMHDDTSDIHEPSCDWPDACHESQAEPSDDAGWVVTQELSGAPGVEALLDSGGARYAVEARCAHSMYSRSATSKESTTKIEVPLTLTGNAMLYLWPGVVTVEDCELDTAGSAWGDGRVTVAKGRWLVRGAPLEAKSPGSSPLVFRPDKDMKPAGRVDIATETGGGDTRIVVKAHPDRIARLHADDAALMACYATALSLIAYDPDNKGPVYTISRDETTDAPTVEGSWLGDALVRRLADKGVPLWDDDGWDPMRAASAFVPLEPPPDEDAQD